MAIHTNLSKLPVATQSGTISFNKALQNLVAVRDALIFQLFDEKTGFVWREVSMVSVRVYSCRKPLRVTFRMKLGGIEVSAKPEHLYGAGFTYHQQNRAGWHIVTGFLMTYQRPELNRQALKQGIPLAVIGDRHCDAPDGLTVFF